MFLFVLLTNKGVTDNSWNFKQTKTLQHICFTFCIVYKHTYEEA